MPQNINLNRCLMGNFRKLRVWQIAKDLAVKKFKLTSVSGFSTDFGLKDQIQRAYVSISASIAEGDELDTDKQSNRHFYIARASSDELQTLLIIAEEICYIGKIEAEVLTPFRLYAFTP